MGKDRRAREESSALSIYTYERENQPRLTSDWSHNRKLVLQVGRNGLVRIDVGKSACHQQSQAEIASDNPCSQQLSKKVLEWVFIKVAPVRWLNQRALRDASVANPETRVFASVAGWRIMSRPTLEQS